MPRYVLGGESLDFFGARIGWAPAIPCNFMRGGVSANAHLRRPLPEPSPSKHPITSQEKGKIIDRTKNHVLTAAHPSGLSASRGFFGCRHFSAANQWLEKEGLAPIQWQL